VKKPPAPEPAIAGKGTGTRGASQSDPASKGRDALARLPQDELLRLCLYHDERAWEEFVRRYSRLIHSVILRYELPVEERKEAYQATIVAAFRQLASLRSPDKLVSWIIGIASRQAINRIRSARREVPVETVTDDHLRDGPAPPPPQPLPDADLLLLERAQNVREALLAIPDRCGRLLRALFFEDPTPEYREIAAREAIPVGNIGSLRARCFEKLRGIMEARGWLD
jgi:RNA polymerase sigma factor (sigma-70 family)